MAKITNDKIVLDQFNKFYSLSEEDFKKPSSVITSYKVGERVTRSNFVYLLITSFAVSIGQLSTQALFFRWLRVLRSVFYDKIWIQDNGLVLCKYSYKRGHRTQ